MNRKKDWLIAAALSFGMIGAAHSAIYMKYEGVKGEAAAPGSDAPKEVAPKPDEPQKGLLLPAVQKASDIAPDTPPPAPRSKPRVAVGDVNGDGRANAPIRHGTMTVRKAGERPLENSGQAARGKHFKDAKLTSRKAGEGQSNRSGRVGQIRTNQ
ncbi:MAG TPA: hypothetical protein PKC48_09640 [Sphingorhabdus sp.]|jgi:hypothetical protein|uniref:hypothetical protein n=1 Tax=Sphingorhabdus sp. TaxID=1902408 RepID=UPI002C54CD9F|nr:hypothetical protein [Sphingorhabdus sp.]HMT40926.1 hypothetical protein [Sphingorhabdus sp.]HMU22543.1 hypothetical protein [Sphingorhabdus sp.]